MKEKLRGIADEHGIGFIDRGDKVEFYIHYSDGFMWHTAALFVWWVQNPDGEYNYWTDDYFDGKHHIVGPGYPAYAIHDQEPVKEVRLLALVDQRAAHMKYYKQFNYHI